MTGTIVISILESDPDRVRRLLRIAPPGCAIAEIRGDLLPSSDLPDLVAGSPLPVILTLRPRSLGGRYDGTEADREAVLQKGLDAGAAFVDVEWGSGPAERFLGTSPSRTVLSSHDSRCTIDVLLPLYEQMARTPAARLKMVPTASSVAEISAVRELLARAAVDRRLLACFARGPAGSLSRLMALHWGSWATYGAAYPGGETAEGQFTAADMADLYDVAGIGSETRLFALVGGSLGGSPSAAMHRACYLAQGVDARYFPVELQSIEDVEDLVPPRGVVRFRSFGVTMPFKEDAARRADTLGRWSATAGAVNTVTVSEDGSWTGANTDARAIADLVGGRTSVKGLRALVIGAGGTGRSIAAVLAAGGARVVLANRDPDRGAKAAATLGVQTVPWNEIGRVRADIMANATPIGKDGDRLIGLNQECRMIIDASYGVEPTPLVAEARGKGLDVVDGIDLLVAQGEGQYEIMTGRRPPHRKVMADAVRMRLGSLRVT